MRDLTTSRGVTFRRPVADEKAEQAQILTLVGALGGAAWVLGTRRAQYCGTCGARTLDQGTRQTPGIPDLYVVLPASPRSPMSAAVPMWIEVKGRGGTLSDDQVAFRATCARAGHVHLVGGVDAVLEYLETYGWVLDAGRGRAPGEVPGSRSCGGRP